MEKFNKPILDCKELNREQGDDSLLDLWEESHLEARELQKKVRLESAALLKSEESHAECTEARQKGFRANWIAYGYVHKVEKDRLKEGDEVAFSEKSKERLSEEFVDVVGRGAKSFQEALKPIEFLAEGVAIEDKEIELCLKRCVEVREEIGEVRREVGREIGQSNLPPEETKRYEKLLPKLGHDERPCRVTNLNFLSKKGVDSELVLSEEGMQTLKYRAGNFEKKFEVIDKPFIGVPLDGLEPLIDQFVAAQENGLPLLRNLSIEAALQGREARELEGFFRGDGSALSDGGGGLSFSLKR